MRLFLVCAAAALLLLAALFVAKRKQSRESAGPVVAKEARASAVQQEPARANRASLAEGDGEDAQTKASLREYLANYWGPRWTDIEAAMIASGLNLELEYTPSPWEEARPLIVEKLLLDEEDRRRQIDILEDWPASEDAKALMERFPGTSITDADLIEVQSLADPFNVELHDLGERWAESMNVHIQEKVARGDFIRAPFSLIGSETDSGFYVSSPASRGWVVQLVLREEECPEMMTIMNEASRLASARDEAIRARFSVR